MDDVRMCLRHQMGFDCMQSLASRLSAVLRLPKALSQACSGHLDNCSDIICFIRMEVLINLVVIPLLSRCRIIRRSKTDDGVPMRWTGEVRAEPQSLLGEESYSLISK